jgi:hypothetical protein
MNFFKWKRLFACHYKQDTLNQIDLIRPRTGNILVQDKEQEENGRKQTEKK